MRMARVWREQPHPQRALAAIYLGQDQWCSILNEKSSGPDRKVDLIQSSEGLQLTFSGVPMYRVNSKSHCHIALEDKQ